MGFRRGLILTFDAGLVAWFVSEKEKGRLLGTED